MQDDACEDLSSGSAVIGAFTTAQARLHLLKEMTRLGDRVLYTDTDSIVYVSPKGEPPLIKIGWRMGEWTNELKPGAHITKFIGLGCHNGWSGTVLSHCFQL